MTTVPLAEVKAHLSELVGRVNDHHERLTVTVHGRPSAVLIAIDELESLEETLAILSDPATLRRLADRDSREPEPRRDWLCQVAEGSGGSPDVGELESCVLQGADHALPADSG